ncbi:glycoside hydrolase family 55 protein [Piedraia hortae CBS 480.64]|uniref:Glycoside hydrolase family 55 protein n=1 Tax=Piedraia hortae CBS 480.64 TaxID=1314780 RepID=A0A6A7C608_9PEZI|nr:glycoside hydrolase family 55 protein [Piedraia hortae CBS 480.64]
MLTKVLAALSLFGLNAAALPAGSPGAAAADYWMADPKMHNTHWMWGNQNGNYKVFRDVTQYGAKGDGSSDDTQAINKAMLDGNRCLKQCNSSTTSQAIVYFPPGQYKVSKPIVMPYYTQVIGDANNLPTVVASSDFSGMAVFDADPYTDQGVSYFINQNNFFRQMRNLVIDLRQTKAGAGIHWQTAQATSLQNIVFEMSQDGDNQQQGIFMDNGSGGWMSDLVFNGGNIGMFLGSQQFTTNNLTFNNCKTAIFMNWNWGWTFSGITVNGGQVGLNMSNSPQNQTVGSVLLTDSCIGSKYGIVSAFHTENNVPVTGGSLVLDNVDMTRTTSAVMNIDGHEMLAKGQINAWVAGHSYVNSNQMQRSQGPIAKSQMPQSLLSNGKVFFRTKPQYEGEPTGNFLRSFSDGGCAGDGRTVVTQCLQNFLNNAAQSNKIAYFEHGVYKVDNTVSVPANVRIVGELWATILATGFNDAAHPKPVWQIGKPGQKGAVEISDMLFEVQGPNPGAIMIQWDLQSEQGKSGMWDSHVRIGGSYGSELLLSDCPTTLGANPNQKCQGVFLMFYASPQSGGIMIANCWWWVADHDMEDPLNRQISIFSGRGALIRSQGPVWLWGSASEHSMLYQYQFDGAKAIFTGFIQTETPYFSGSGAPPFPHPLPGYNSDYDDPTFAVCQYGDVGQDGVPCKEAWGLRVVNSQGVYIYAAGFYSFFNNYQQECVGKHNCQLNMVRFQQSDVHAYTLTTKASVHMILDDSTGTVFGKDNRNVFGDTIAYYATHQ